MGVWALVFIVANIYIKFKVYMVSEIVRMGLLYSIYENTKTSITKSYVYIFLYNILKG